MAMFGKKWSKDFANHILKCAAFNPNGFRMPRTDGTGYTTILEWAAYFAGMSEFPKPERSVRGQRKVKRKKLYLLTLNQQRLDNPEDRARK